MKKPDAITEIRKDEFKDKIWPLPASDLLKVVMPGVMGR